MTIRMASKPQIQIETRQVGPLALRAEVASVNEEKRTVDLVWSTGAKVLRFDWYEGEPFLEELSMDPTHVRLERLNGGAPFLANHNSYSVEKTPGVVVEGSARVAAGKGYATVRFDSAENDPDAEKLFRKIQNKIVRNVSIGYRVHKMEKLAKGEGDKYRTHRAIDWEPNEISAVSIGADAGAGFRSAKADELNPCIFTDHNRALPTETHHMEKTPEQIEAENKARAAEIASAVENAQKLERERASGILSAFRAARLPETEAAAMVADPKVSLEQARALVLERMAKASDEIQTDQRVRVEVGEADAEKFARGISDSILRRSNNAGVREAIAKKLPGFENVGDGGQYRGASLIDIARLCLARTGTVKGLSMIFDRERIAGDAFMQRSGYATPSDFPIILEDIARKTLMANYAIQAATWKRWVGTDSVSNFLTHTRVRKGTFGGLPVVAAEAEYQNMAIPDGSKVEIDTETRGAIIAIGRHAVVNDELGALTNVASEFGAAAGKSIELAAYALLAQNSGLGPTMSDSQAFFHANRDNVGSSSAISVAGLDADRLVMRAQQDDDANDFLDLEPRILLVPPGLESAAKILNSDAYDPAQVGQKTNAVRGMFGDIVSSPRLTASTTRRYLFTDSKQAFVCVFLDGSGEAPTLSSQEGFRRDGMEFKARIDFKVQPFDPKAAVTNAGT